MAESSPSSTSKKTTLTLIIGFFVAIIPAVFGYFQNKDEIAARYSQSNAASASGYQALVASVKELQAAVTSQHDTIVKLESSLEALEMITQLELQQRFPGPRERSQPRVPLAIPRPTLHLPPVDFNAAIQSTAAP